MRAHDTSTQSTGIGRHRQIVDDFRRKILGKVLFAEDRLPTRNELAETYRTSKKTVQFALNQLADEGLVEARGRGGTYVLGTGSVRSTYGLVFRYSISDPIWSWSPFLNALHREARVFDTHRPGKRIECYFGVTDPLDREQNPQLWDAIDQDRLAGLIIVDSTSWRSISKLNVPRVHVGGETQSPCPVIDTSIETWMQRAVKILRQSRRKNVALINNASRSPKQIDQMVAMLTKAGMSVQPHWVQGIHADHARWARNCANLMMRSAGPQTPDALLITDDSLVDHTICGLVDAGISVEHDMAVIALSNFPWSPPSAVPVTRLGFDMRQLLTTAVNLLDQQRLGQKVTWVTQMPALLQDEAVSLSSAEPAVAEV